MATKIIDAVSGSGTFQNPDLSVTYEVLIVGSPLANIKAFYSEGKAGIKGYLLKASCSSWNGASLVIRGKTDHIDDSFTNTGDIFTEDSMIIFRY
jgi:hypothetical protein